MEIIIFVVRLKKSIIIFMSNKTNFSKKSCVVFDSLILTDTCTKKREKIRRARQIRKKINENSVSRLKRYTNMLTPKSNLTTLFRYCRSL
jgi:hypothetical protein